MDQLPKILSKFEKAAESSMIRFQDYYKSFERLLLEVVEHSALDYGQQQLLQRPCMRESLNTFLVIVQICV